MKIITNGKKNKTTNKTETIKNKYLWLHLHIHVGHVKQPQSISEILYVIFKLTYPHTDLLNFM